MIAAGLALITVGPWPAAAWLIGLGLIRYVDVKHRAARQPKFTNSRQYFFEGEDAGGS